VKKAESIQLCDFRVGQAIAGPGALVKTAILMALMPF